MARARISLVDKDLGWGTFTKACKELKKDAHVKVGVLDNGGPGSTSRGTLTNAEVAAVNEFGTADGHVPARPFVSASLAKNQDAYADMLKTLILGIVTGRMDARRALSIVGAKAAADIKAYVVGGDEVPPPNAPSTIRRKSRGGVTRTLVDTAQMLASVTWEVVTGR